MNSDQRYRCEMLRGAMNAIHQQLREGMMPAELAVTDSICDDVEAFTRDSSNADAQAWHKAAVVTKRLLRERDANLRSEWIGAYAGLPPMEMPSR